MCACLPGSTGPGHAHLPQQAGQQRPTGKRCSRLHVCVQKHKPTDHLWKMERIAKDMMAELRVGSYPDAGVTSLQECRCAQGQVSCFWGLRIWHLANWWGT